MPSHRRNIKVFVIANHPGDNIDTLITDRRHDPRSSIPRRWQIRTTNAELPIETCITNNVSRCGFYFVTSSKHYTPGMKLSLIRDFDPPRSNFNEEIGEVLRVDLLSDNKAGVAVRIRRSLHSM
jgi:hypothetical protein